MIDPIGGILDHADGALGRSDDKVARGIAEQTEEIAKVLQQSGKLDKAAENSAKALGRIVVPPALCNLNFISGPAWPH